MRMRLPEAFWAFSFEINISNVFQQKVLPSWHPEWRHCVITLVEMFLQTAMKLFIIFCFKNSLKTAIHYYEQTEQQIQKMHMAIRTRAGKSMVFFTILKSFFLGFRFLDFNL